MHIFLWSFSPDERSFSAGETTGYQDSVEILLQKIASSTHAFIELIP